MLAIAGLSVISIVGRALTGIGLKPVPGDFELVEIGTAVAVFCFLPWTHLRRAHAVVDLFWPAIPKPVKPLIVMLGDVLMLLLWALLVWRMGVATLEYRSNGETSFILLMPVWWGYALAWVVGFVGLFAYVWKLAESLGLTPLPAQYASNVEGAH